MLNGLVTAGAAWCSSGNRVHSPLILSASDVVLCHAVRNCGFFLGSPAFLIIIVRYEVSGLNGPSLSVVVSEILGIRLVVVCLLERMTDRDFKVVH
ncbi:hypothetical protein T10_12085 [Trichinella papuae]|uniref:Uncharacterized protein n=1 Tax=Trichinella papuae TaxID=268474 RepID=A0A0V1MIN2_9BILA|nr:hypothetical protein T10_12085 [Trichinella papuae]